ALFPSPVMRRADRPGSNPSGPAEHDRHAAVLHDHGNLPGALGVDEHLVEVGGRLLHVAIVDAIALLGVGLTGLGRVGSAFLAVDDDGPRGHGPDYSFTGRGGRHSSDSARTGSMRVARRAGRYAASVPTAASTTAAARNVAGSAGCTPNSRPPSRRASAAAPTAPSRMASPVRASARPTTSLVTRPEAAPSAMRMPISRVRWETEYDMTP